jgi:diamine N-acetyltransferase
MDAEITLREITAETVRTVTALEVRSDQHGLVASNANSIAEAYFEPKAWFRAVAAGEELVGFVMVYRDPEASIFYVWRFMIDARHQGKGYGRRAMELVIDEARRDGVPAVGLSVVPGERSAADFYRQLGFEETGTVHEGELEMRFVLEPETDRNDGGR